MEKLQYCLVKLFIIDIGREKKKIFPKDLKFEFK